MGRCGSRQCPGTSEGVAPARLGTAAEAAARFALDWPDTGRAWWAADGAWSACRSCRRVERAAARQRCPPRRNGTTPLQMEVITHTYTHIHTRPAPCPAQGSRGCGSGGMSGGGT
jgi:hypothetical protein